MAILRLSKELNDIKAITATTVGRWVSRSSSAITTGSGIIHDSSSDDNHHHNNYKHFWMYEIPDNESQVAGVAVVKASACQNNDDVDTAHIWDTLYNNCIDNNNNNNVGLPDHPYVSSWYPPSSSSSLQCPCSTRTVFYRTLYWGKQIILKVGRSYYALPVLLLLSTLSLGILLGYIIGYRRGRYHPHQSRDRHQIPPPPAAAASQQQKAETSRQSTVLYFNILFPVVHQSYRIVWRLWECFQIGWNFVFRFRHQQSRSSSLDTNKSSNYRHQPQPRKPFDMDPMSANAIKECHGCNCSSSSSNSSSHDIEQKELAARLELHSNDETQCESGLSRQELPDHIAVVMDGNRRYGLQKYNDPIMGHWDGSKKLVQFVKWCVAEHIQELTVYAFSTENWSRSTNEVSALMNIIMKHCEELRVEAIAKQISIRIKSTDTESIPASVREVLHQLEKDTHHSNPSLRMNICLSYGSRGEIVQACRAIVTEYQNGNWTSLTQITEDSITEKLLVGSSLSCAHRDIDTPSRPDHQCNQSRPPDIFLRTSGEVRLSNFLLWQMAYTELFFLQKNWPELNKDDFLNVLQSYANCRQRRFGR